MLRWLDSKWRVRVRKGIVGVIVVLLFAFSTPTIARQDDAVASLDPVEGLVQIQSADDDPHRDRDWQAISRPVLVAEGDRIRTDRFGLAYLTFFEGVDVEIRGNTFIVVSTLDLTDLSNDNFDITVDVLLGLTLSNVQATLDADDRFEVHTPGATAVVRGTQWWTVVGQDGRTGFESLEGTVMIYPRQPDAAPYALAAGETRVFGADGSELPPPASLNVPPPETPALPLGTADVCGDGRCGMFEVAACPYDCLNQLDMTACGDGVCDPAANESYLICPTDCAIFPGALCGDGTCAPDESGITCAADCDEDQYFQPADPALCGNGQCDVSESALNCAIDCVTFIYDPDEPLPPSVTSDQLTLPDEVLCVTAQEITLIVQYAPQDDAVLAAASARALTQDVEVVTTEVLGPREFRADLYCAGRSGTVGRVLVSVTDTAGRTVSSTVDVHIQ